MQSNKKTALVTGSSRGIGLACAKALAKHGFNLILNAKQDISKEKIIQQAKADIESLGAQCVIAYGDISDLSAHAPIIDKALSKFGSIDCLVNNAGVGALSRGDMLDMTPESWDHCLNINAKGLFFLSQLVAKQMLLQNSDCSIINVTSCSAKIISLNRVEYCVSKAAASMATQALALRLAASKVRVFEIRPGIIKTDMTAPVKGKYDQLISQGLVPEKRWGQTDDIAQTVVALASGVMPYTVGQIIDIDGGLHIPNF